MDAEVDDENRLEAYHEALMLFGVSVTSSAQTSNSIDDRWQQRVACVEALEHLRRAGLASLRNAATGSIPRAENGPTNVAQEWTLTRIGHFEIIRELGRGGHGIVFLVNDLRLDRQVALKMPLPECMLSSSMRERFLREARIAARLAHPNLLAVHESGEEGPMCYIVSDYCTGPTLSAWMQTKEEPVAPKLAASIVAALADGVAFAHKFGVLHRDIKPNNVFLDASPAGFVTVHGELHERCIPKLGDFGLARFADEAHDATRTGSVLGTPAYISPEQARGERVNEATDVYGLGTVLFELLGGRPPYRGSTAMDVLQQVINDDAPPLRKLRPDASVDLEAITAKCLDKLPKRRYANAAELAADLRRYLNGEPILARQATVIERLAKWTRRRPMQALMATMSIVVFAAAFAVTLFHNQRVSKLLDIAQRERLTAEHHASLAKKSELETRAYAYPAELQLALHEWVGGNRSNALRLLQRHVPRPGEKDMRDFAWHFLHRLVGESPLFIRQEGSIRALAVTPDAKLVATAGADGVIRLWDFPSGRHRKHLQGTSSDGIETLAIAPNGKLLIASGNDSRIRRWTLPDGASLTPLTGCEGWNAEVAFSPDGQWIAAGGADRVIRLWRSESGEPAGVLKGHQETIRSLAFSPRDGLLSSSEDGEVRAWRLSTLTPDERLPDGKFAHQSDSYAYKLRVEAGGNAVIAGMYFRDLLAWDLRDEQFGKPLKCSTDVIGARCIASDERDVLAVGCSDGAIHFEIVPVQRTDRFRPRYGHNDRINDMRAVPGTGHLLTASNDGTSRLVAYPIVMDPVRANGEFEVGCLTWRDHWLVSCQSNHTVLVFDLETKSLTASHWVRRLARAAIAPRRRLLVTSSARGELTMRQLDGTNVLWTSSIDGRSHQILIDAEERFLVSTSENELVVFDLLSGEVLRRLSAESDVSAFHFLGSSSIVCSGWHDGHIRTWDVNTGDLLDDHDLGESIHDVVPTIDGERIATRSARHIAIWDRRTWKNLGRFTIRDNPSGMLLLDGGQTLAVQFPDAVHFFQAANGHSLLDLTGEFPLDSMALSPDGRRIATIKGCIVDFIDGRPMTNEESVGSAVD